MQRTLTSAAARPLLGVLLTSALCLTVASAAAAATETQDKAQLQKQLDDARGRLDDAARDVANLSRKLYGDEIAEIPGLVRAPRGSMLGINIGGGTERAEGVEVTSVSPAGPAETAGLRKGDVIVAIDGKALRKTGDGNAGRQLVDHLRGVPPGQKVKLDYLRDGRKAAIAVTTVPAEPPMIRAMREHLPMLEGMALPQGLEDLFNPGGRGFRALELVPITPKLGQYFGAEKGLLVVKAPAATGPALEEGDVILTIDGRTPETARHAFRILGSYQPQEKVKIEVLRQRKRMTLEMELPDVGARPPSHPDFVPPVPPVRPPSPSAPAGGKSGIDS